MCYICLKFETCYNFDMYQTCNVQTESVAANMAPIAEIGKTRK
jgi:hypothetical protein